jgi:hypothetical protein
MEARVFAQRLTEVAAHEVAELVVEEVNGAALLVGSHPPENPGRLVSPVA